ncbi:Isoprenylcysteine carboxyl methyltransferase [Candidatus Sulfotelmatomonas gaucii]|uniref:Isoprenylcysteine carboxyl methyltransferase n=1 Tax=Candidatus Sulfuritelmatomonas gaucii TaxID=2043161 RepID=A0A2N9LAA4_9BACT|nr:Isoprenylcysteine carboxyl methyltransferase [Candidatus Sulfotelmatomonas gaucii]
MFVLVRTLTYATIFVGLLFIYLPARLLAWSGIVHPISLGWPQIIGLVIGSGGALLALACISAFIFIGKGTPAPFDPPRRLVVRGPYRFVRNPMYMGAALVLAGTALYYQSAVLLAFLALFILATHLFVVIYEEPTLHRSFGSDYVAYCDHVRRWRPTASRS